MAPLKHHILDISTRHAELNFHNEKVMAPLKRQFDFQERRNFF